MTHSFGSPAMVALNIPLNHSMHVSNRRHPTKPYHNTARIRFNYGHLIITGTLCPLGKKALTFSLNLTRLIQTPR